MRLPKQIKRQTPAIFGFAEDEDSLHVNLQVIGAGRARRSDLTSRPQMVVFAMITRG